MYYLAMPQAPKVPVKEEGLYLFIRGNPSIPGHHGLYRHKSGNGGSEYHARNIGFGWVKETGITHGLPESMGMILLLHVGVVPEDEFSSFESILKGIAVRPYDSSFNCIVWAREALEALVSQRVVALKPHKSVEDLLEEAQVVSLSMRDDVMDGTKTPQAIDSNVCML
jgi:hypothetical protein